MREYGLIGKVISHSFSAKYFADKFMRNNITDATYSLFPMPNLDNLIEWVLSKPNINGFNVTIPYKEAIIPFLNTISDEANKIKSVNVVAVTRTGNKILLDGYNTDVIGFELAIRPLLLPCHTKALILGTGGASKSVEYVLKKLGMEIAFVSRNEKPGILKTYEQLNSADISDFKVIINTTPLGTHPDTDECPQIPYEHITKQHLAFDLVYNPEQTLFLKKALVHGAITQNGLSMLHNQADSAWDIWSNYFKQANT